MPKTRYEMAKQLEKLLELHQKAGHIYSSSKDKYVSLGLLTGEEMSEYIKAQDVELQIHIAMDKAKKALPEPNVEGKLPDDFVKLERRRRELDTRCKLIDSVRSILSNLQLRGPFSSEASRAIWLPRTAERVKNIYASLADPDHEEMTRITQSIENKTRANSVVRRIREEIWGKHRQQEQEAAQQIKEQIEERNKEVLDRKIQLDALIVHRRQALLEPIKQEIEELLESATG